MAILPKLFKILSMESNITTVITNLKIANLAKEYDSSNEELEDPKKELKYYQDRLKMVKERKLPGDKEFLAALNMKILSLKIFLMETGEIPNKTFAKFFYGIKRYFLSKNLKNSNFTKTL